MSLYRNVVWFMKGFKEYTKSGYETASKCFDDGDLQNVDISRRSFMVTGANSGVGKVTAMNIAKKGGIVHMICRNEERGKAALKELQEASGSETIYLHVLDISKPKDIKQFVHLFVTSGHSLHVLINNAGVLVPEAKRQVTDDGLEVTFATNSLGTHILTRGLMPVLEAADDPRVIIVSSGGMFVQKLDLSDLQFEKMTKFDGTMAYSQTKRQQVIMTSEFAKAYPRVHFSSMHPGWADTPGVRSSMPEFYDKLKNKLRTEEQGADTILWLAISDAARKNPSGLFFQDRKAIPVHLPLAWTKSTDEQHEKLMGALDEFSSRYS